MILVSGLFLSGCGLLPGLNRLNSHWNEPLEGNRSGVPTRATLSPDASRGKRKDVLVLLALSGGGSRAAYFSAAVMFRLQELGFLQEVDAISAVSGGGLPAALYCLSRDPGSSPPGESWRPVWERSRVLAALSRDFTLRWIGRWLLPWNLIRFWWTSFDRTDIMAQVLSVNLFEGRFSTEGKKMRDLSPERPILILNATDRTEDISGDPHFGTLFTFTREDFEGKLSSDLERYPIARAVMASASFPAAFNSMTLRDFRPQNEGSPPRYLHLFDGGNYDNLGLETVKGMVNRARNPAPGGGPRPARVVVICVDAFTHTQAVDRNLPDPRNLLSYVVDRNFMDTFDVVMNRNRKLLLDDFESKRIGRDGARVQELEFWHLQFEDVRPGIDDPYQRGALRDQLLRIPTAFSISGRDCDRIERAVKDLLPDSAEKVREIRQFLGITPAAPSPEASPPGVNGSSAAAAATP